jgi:hypothetical protein
MPDVTPDQVRRAIGDQLTEAQANALVDWYAALATAVADFPEKDLKGTEPPLRSTPGPRAR